MTTDKGQDADDQVAEELIDEEAATIDPRDPEAPEQIAQLAEDAADLGRPVGGVSEPTREDLEAGR